jgi:hypothetical protein
MRPRHVLGVFLIFVLLVMFRLLSPRSTRSTLSTRTTPAPIAPSPTPEPRGGHDVPVPASCTPEVNQKLADLVAQQTRTNADNVMVCGVTISPSRTQRGGEHGSHQILPLLVNLPGAGSKLVEVVTNDDLDGLVTAPKGVAVFAYGQAFFDEGSRFAAGIHDVHCATHRAADNGWVVVNGVKSPASCPVH